MFKFGKYQFESFKQFHDLQLIAEQKDQGTPEQFDKFLEEQSSKNLIKKIA